MPQPYQALPNTFRLRVQKSGSEDPSDSWFNEYDFVYPIATQPAAGDAIVAAIVAYERTLHYSDVNFLGVVAEDYHVGVPPAGVTPFNAFFPLTGTGNAPGSSNSLAGQSGGPIGGEVCLIVNRFVSGTRRGGRNFYRGCLQKNDVAGTAGGEWSIINNSQFPGQFAAISLPHMAPYLTPSGGPTAPYLILVHTKRAATVPHYVISLSGSAVASLALSMTPTTNKISRKSHR